MTLDTLAMYGIGSTSLDSSPTARLLPTVPVTVQDAGTSTVMAPAGISMYAVVSKYTDQSGTAALVPTGIPVAASRSAERVKRRVVVAAASGSRVSPLKAARWSRKSE